MNNKNSVRTSKPLELVFHRHSFLYSKRNTRVRRHFRTDWESSPHWGCIVRGLYTFESTGNMEACLSRKYYMRSPCLSKTWDHKRDARPLKNPHVYLVRCFSVCIRLFIDTRKMSSLFLRNFDWGIKSFIN